jgi:transposase
MTIRSRWRRPGTRSRSLRVIEPHVGRVVLANPEAVRNATRSAKTDKLDARTLARLLAAGFLAEVWPPDERTRVLRRRISRRAQLVRQRTREKNQVHAILIRNLKGRAPATDLFGSAGRRWLGEQELPVDEREMLEACLRGIDFLDLLVPKTRIGERGWWFSEGRGLTG